MQFLVIILVLAYFIYYFKQIYEGIRIRKLVTDLIDQFQDVLSQAQHSIQPTGHRFEDYTQAGNLIRENLVSKMPQIKEVIPYGAFYNDLNYTSSDETLYSNSWILYNSLVKENDSLNYHYFKFLNPVTPIKKVFLLPSVILSWFGINLNTFASRVVSLLIYIFTWIMNQYGEFIINLVKELIR